MSPLTDRDLEELDNWLRVRIIRLARRSTEGLSEKEATATMNQAFAFASKLSWTSDEGASLMATRDGVAKVLFQGIHANHPEVTDLLITGGDPLFMKSTLLRRYIEPVLKAQPGNLKTIRFGTKSLAYWPYRFLTDKDSDDIIALFEEIVEAGFHLSVMAHFTHIRELSTEAVEKAIERLHATGAVIRCQSPLIRHINDDADMWARMWEKQVAMGMVPYYMFIARDTGPREYFDIPIERAYRIFSDAYRQVSGLARTVRGPSMSTKPGKILVDGISEINGEKQFVLKMIQGRDASWVNRVFFARYDPKASWLSDLKPTFGKEHFFFDKGASPREHDIPLHRHAAMEVKSEMTLSIKQK